MRDHGGDPGAAMIRYGGTAGDWIDLSTGINRVPWPVPVLAPQAWRDLPGAAAFAACADAARSAWRVADGATCLPLAGAQAAIGLVPRLCNPGQVAILGPTYNEHAAGFSAEGWDVREVRHLADLAGAQAAVVVNPNNPDGQRHDPAVLLDLADRTGLLVVDESFGDAEPARSLCPSAGRPGLIVLRSFGKFYGLAGLRLGFAIGAPQDMERLRALAGPWAVSGPALAIGAAALGDAAWADAARARLADEGPRIDALAQAAGWTIVGGTALFRLYDTPDAAATQDQLARHRIWSRRFGYSAGWLRLGLPGTEAEWDRLAAALSDPAT